MNIERFKFLLQQRVIGFDIPDSPWFDSNETTTWFLDRLAEAKRYLEYGTGGSTYSAARLGVSFIAVDSDPFFIRAVQKKIRSSGYYRHTDQIFHYANIGPTGPWGRPVGPVSSQRLDAFRRYSNPPSECFDQHRLPDLVLIDGRFRVACALKAIRMLSQHEGWTMVVDDYVGRPAYSTIADFADLVRCVGRMGVFAASPSTDYIALEAAINHYECIPD